MAFRISYILSAVLVALLSGTFFGTWWGVEPTVVDHPQNFTLVHQLLNEIFGSTMPFMFLATAVALAVTAFLLRRSGDRGTVLVVIACACIVTMFITTVTGNVPANLEFDTWSVANPPADWTSWRDRWELFHNIRTVLGIVAIASLASVALVRGDRRPQETASPVGAASSV